MSGPGMEERRVVVLREACAAAMLPVLVGLAGAVLSADQAGTAVLMAGVSGLIAARMTENLSRVALAAVAVAVFVFSAATASALPAGLTRRSLVSR